MTRALVLAAAALVATVAPAQTGRTTSLPAPPLLGATFQVEVHYPLTAAGNLFAFMFSAPFPGSVTLPPVGSLTFVGDFRVDPSSNVVLGLNTYLGSGVEAMQVAVPASPTLLGASFDVQSIDLGPQQSLYLADTDAQIVVTSGPDPALGMVAIAPGTFPMGSSAAPLGIAPYFNAQNAQPVHQVTISRPFWIGAHEVTQAQYQAVMGSNPSWFQGSAYPNAAQQPVEQVSWTAAVAYCQALTATERAAGRVPAGYEYRLPTEAEWEYCCRAGTTTEFCFGATLVCGQANFDYSYHSNTYCGIGHTAVVGSFPANAWGLYDMHGNVMEWCYDTLAAYTASPETDPHFQTGTLRVTRGGSWLFNSNFCRSGARLSGNVSFSGYLNGFRVVCAPTLP